jgi:hypothetical protein
LPNHGICHYVAFCRIMDERFLFNDSSQDLIQPRQAIEDTFPQRQGSSQTAMLLVYAACGPATGQ